MMDQKKKGRGGAREKKREEGREGNRGRSQQIMAVKK